MTQTNILELAKQGDPRAIAALLTRQLQPLGTSVKAALKDGCLQLMLESEQVPEQHDVMEIVRDGITSLEAESIQKVKVYGRQTGEKSPTWAQEFDVEAKAEFPSFSYGSNADEQDEYQQNYHAEDVDSSVNEEEPEFSYAEENNSSSGKGVKFAPVAGGLKSLKAAPSKVKLIAAGGLAALVIAGGAIYKFTMGGEEAATEPSPAPVAVAKPANTATKAKPIPAPTMAAKPQSSSTTAKAKPTPAATMAAKAKPTPAATMAAKAKPTPAATMAAKPQSSPTAAKPAPVAAANSQADAMQQAVNKAQTAANLVQSAKSKQQWRGVATEWEQAIALMKSVPKTHPKYQLAQQRVGQYQQFLAYAQQNAKR